MNGPMLLGVALVLAAPLPKDAPKPAAPPIVGAWTCTAITDGGRPNKDDVKSGLVFEFTSDLKLRVTKSGKTDPDGTYTIDPELDPAAIDLQLEADAPFVRGIFKIEGEVLTMCFDDGRPCTRPTEFTSPKETTLMVVTFKRNRSK